MMASPASTSSDHGSERPVERRLGAHVSRGFQLADRGVRWRRDCYPAVTPALELVTLEFPDRANTRWSLADRANCKLLDDREIRR